MKSKKILTNIAIIFLSIMTISYIIIQLVSGLSSGVECEYADVSSIESALTANCYIFRNENLVSSNNSGVVNYVVKESEKISKKQLIAEIFNTKNSVRTQNEIKEIDRKIAIFEKSVLDTTYLVSNVDKFDSKIYGYIDQIRANVEMNSLNGISQLKSDLMISYNKKYLVTNNKTGFNAQLSDLYSQKETLTRNLDSRIESIISDKSGYFSTILDGYENTFTVDKAENYNIDQFKSLFQTKANSYDNNVIGKIVVDFDWYAVCIVSQDEAAGIRQGKDYKLNFIYSPEQYVTANLFRKVTQTDSDEACLVFKINKIYSGFDYTRCQTVKITYGYESGIIVPKSAVRNTDDGLGVFTLEGSTVSYKKISIKNNDENSFICEVFDPNDISKRDYLAKHDRIIIKGKNLYKGRIIN